VIPESYLLLREMPSFEFGAYYNDGAFFDTLSMRNPIVMVKNDCIISSGRTLLESFDRMEVAEYSARATIAAVPFGGMKPMNQDQVDEIVEAFNLIP
ncbi:MAG: class II aldolase/adducin family protein, partial [Lentisphaeria bacterium]|nr:class II aldolase/adducin family protein [Lentisphaeria bacterium]